MDDRPAIAEWKTLIFTSCVGIFLPGIIRALNPTSLSKAIDWWGCSMVMSFKFDSSAETNVICLI